MGIETTGIRLVANKITSEEIDELKSFFNPFLNSNSIDCEDYLKADTDFH